MHAGDTERRPVVPQRLVENCRGVPEREAWLEGLPRALLEVRERWSVRLGLPFDDGVSGAAWVAPAVLADGTAAVVKLAMPHMEGEHEIAGLRVWSGRGMVRLLDGDERLGAMLLERCIPGTPLRVLPDAEQDVVIAGLLRRLWEEPWGGGPFRPLASMTAAWAQGASAGAPGDAALRADALHLFAELPGNAPRAALLATDLHAGNVLRARREPWLAIDPKPFVGDPAYDATQHLLNGLPRLRHDPWGTIDRFSGMLGVEAERVRLWTFARLALGGRGDDPREATALARQLSP